MVKISLTAVLFAWLIRRITLVVTIATVIYSAIAMSQPQEHVENSCFALIVNNHR